MVSLEASDGSVWQDGRSTLRTIPGTLAARSLIESNTSLNRHKSAPLRQRATATPALCRFAAGVHGHVDFALEVRVPGAIPAKRMQRISGAGQYNVTGTMDAKRIYPDKKSDEMRSPAF